ncbi:MAG TPA: hypothetical protein O0Y13_04905, partial [Methanocorpusculum sp.]|nr:hypothetical protein [Methanocorpusculum sp.]
LYAIISVMQVTKFWQILQTAWLADGANTTILGKTSQSAQVVSKKDQKRSVWKCSGDFRL